MKLIHIADVHLGKRRLDGKLPHQDFADALAWVVAQSVSEKADAFLIAGDFFDSPHIEPVHLRQAQDCLRPLRDAGIPVIAIEGNHDKPHFQSPGTSWLRYLAEDGLMHLLSIPFTAEGPIISPWDNERKTGSFVDINGLRFVGAGYLGAGTPRRLKAILKTLVSPLPVILLLHAGPEYFVGEHGGFSREDLDYIHAKVAYLALGHIHKPMQYGDWACNPGSLENGDFGEAAYARKADGSFKPRGYACVEVDPQPNPCSVYVTIKNNPKRPMFQVTLDCSSFCSQRRSGSEALLAAAEKLLSEQQYPSNAAVELILSGNLNLARIQFDTDQFSAHLEKALNLVAVFINFAGIGISESSNPDSSSIQMASREDLERKAIHSLVRDEGLWNLSQHEEIFTELFYSLKELVRQNRSPEEIAELLLNNPATRDVQSKLNTMS